MKSYRFWSFVSLLSLGTTLIVSDLAHSQTSPEVNAPQCVRLPRSYIEPERLAELTYHGFLKAQGIPGYNGFYSKFATGQLTGEKVIKAAIAGCLLNSKANNEPYIYAVQQQLQLLFQENGNN